MTELVHIKTSIEIFPDRINRLVDSPGGPVGRHVNSAAQKLLGVARDLVGKRYSGTTGKVTDGRPGHLKDAGRVVPTGGASHAVVFDHPIAYLHHEGASSHVYSKNQWYINQHISTRHDTPFRRHGYIPFSHPGTDGNPYLTNAALKVGLKPSGSLLRGARPTSIFRLRSS